MRKRKTHKGSQTVILALSLEVLSEYRVRRWSPSYSFTELRRQKSELGLLR